MDFIGFESADKSSEEESSMDFSNVEESEEGSLDNSIDQVSSLIAKMKSEIKAVKSGVRSNIRNKIIEESKSRWKEEHDFDPMVLKRRGYLNKELDDSFYESLPKVHPETKFKILNSPNNKLLIRQLNEIDKLLNSLFLDL